MRLQRRAIKYAIENSLPYSCIPYILTVMQFTRCSGIPEGTC